ncbi:probable ATP-dependent RNA helicase spindle-E [Phymastichus coffea]|uniref:probable ATP-dependent RNA helicase spindle-E n=1 Tax=Phymastichus coffea TaxID=108790 RepID=UPI00273B9A66|nr:probable ATP-dependent RNA helicase spindle-E [Phymastichus coffea]
MDLMDLFRPNKEIKRGPLRPRKSNYAPSECSAASIASSIKPLVKENKENGTDYVQKYVEEEKRKALEAIIDCNKNEHNFDMLSIGTVPTHIGTEVDAEELNKFYSTFNFEHRPKDSLPINQSKDEIVGNIQTHAITIIEGVTGCGKSTQVPQFILDDCHNRRQFCNIIVTQPRRIAALSIADRVSKERNWPLGSLVGVQVGMYKNISKDTRLTYCTTGVLLRKLISAKNMLEFTHIILDEVHERDQEMDFLLLVIRKLQRSNSRNVKIILMSATFNAKKFSEYFSIPTVSGFVAAPMISIPKKRNFTVQNHYLCQLEVLGTLPEVVPSDPRVSEKMMLFCMRLVDVFDDIDKGTEYDDDDLEVDGEKPRHATLIFLPGIWEIEEMHNLMNNEAEASKWDIVILHSSITHEEQKKIFDAPPKGYRRIILSTNIAESSITINDVKYVIDFCLTKQLITDPGTNFQCLELTWASKANCEQRSGRAGRLMDGRAYRLISKYFYDQLPEEGDPEIMRAPLENVVLQTKLLDMGEPRAVLALAIDPPDLKNLERTILLLKEAGGLLDKPDTHNKFDGELTDLGRVMAALPIDIHIAKLIALGHVFNVLRDAIIMGACMSLKSMFSNPFRNRMEAYSAKVHWADGTTSDSLAFLSAYHVWQREIAANRFRRKSRQELSWAQRNYIQIKVMHEVDYLVGELSKRLERLGIKETVGPNKLVVDDVDRGLILKIVLAGAFYPNYFVRNQSPVIDPDETQGTRALGGLDPSRTVFLQGWKPDQPGKLYAKRIQEVFRGVCETTYKQTLVEFDGSMRVYIMFNDDKIYGDSQKQTDIPGNVSLSVYKALKLRKMGTEIKIDVLDSASSQQRARELEIDTNACSMFFNEENYETMKRILPKALPQLPGLDENNIQIKISYFINPSQFWVRIADDKDLEHKYDTIRKFLNDSKNITLTRFEDEPSVGALVAARWKKDNKIYRVVIESFDKKSSELLAKVLYIDHGFRDTVRVKELMRIQPDHLAATTRALAFECCLSEIEPSKKKDPKGWSREACQIFCSTVKEAKQIYGSIYSVVDSIVHLQLSTNLDDNSLLDVNKRLVDLNLAEVAEENYLSKYNHKLREQIIDYEAKHREYLEYLQYDKNFLISTYPDPPPLEDCRCVVTLKGPNSPLEIALSSLAIVTSATKVNIEGNSVNSILIDTNPEDPHERLLVAALVSQNQSGTQLTLRNTTLMPNIPGLTALMCLIFAPKIELRRSTRGNQYVGALCGLGFDSRTGLSLMPEHDMEVYFDTEFTIEDLQKINRLRHWMNMGICVQTDQIDDLAEQAVQCQRKVYDLLNLLIYRQTKSQSPEKISNFDKWGLYDECLFLQPTKAVIKEDSIYPLHSALQLNKVDEVAEEMIAHARALRSLAVSDSRLSRTEENMTIYCKICEEEVLGREALRLHLYRSSHRDSEKKYGFKI